MNVADAREMLLELADRAEIISDNIQLEPADTKINRSELTAINMALPMMRSARPNVVKMTTGRSYGYCGICGAGVRCGRGNQDNYCWKCGAGVLWNEID